MWRPKDWRNKYVFAKSSEERFYNSSETDHMKLEAYEAGADAMLKAVRKQRGVNYSKSNTPNSGTYYFVPEEK